MTFTEEWFSDGSCGVLADLGRRVTDIPGLIVEVGSWEGRSTCALANAIAPRTVHAVDTWAGSPGEVSAELAAHRNVYARFLANVEGLNVEPHRMGWREFVPTVTDQRVALVFIDAEHTYEEVHDTIWAFLPLMADGSVICGDDAGHPPVGRAVIDAFGDSAMVQQTVWWVTL
jgi:predicted O-methyltransferase YrrM